MASFHTVRPKEKIAVKNYKKHVSNFQNPIRKKVLDEKVVKHCDNSSIKTNALTNAKI